VTERQLFSLVAPPMKLITNKNVDIKI